LTTNEPRWSSVTANPSSVLIVMVRPWLGSQPAKETCPGAGAFTTVPGMPPTSIPECPRSWYSAPPKSNGRRTGPSAGQVQAAADEGHRRQAANNASVVVFFVNIAATVASRSAVVKTGYSDSR
jgi:hypothetical protein